MTDSMPTLRVAYADRLRTITQPPGVLLPEVPGAGRIPSPAVTPTPASRHPYVLLRRIAAFTAVATARKLGTRSANREFSRRHRDQEPGAGGRCDSASSLQPPEEIEGQAIPLAIGVRGTEVAQPANSRRHYDLHRDAVHPPLRGSVDNNRRIRPATASFVIGGSAPAQLSSDSPVLDTQFVCRGQVLGHRIAEDLRTPPAWAAAATGGLRRAADASFRKLQALAVVHALTTQPPLLPVTAGCSALYPSKQCRSPHRRAPRDRHRAIRAFGADLPAPHPPAPPARLPGPGN